MGRLGAGACHRSRCRLRHSVSSVGPETPSTEKRPLRLLTPGTASGSNVFSSRSPRVRVAPQNPHEGSRNPAHIDSGRGSRVGQRCRVFAIIFFRNVAR
jgi:hypothetical protein